MHHFMPEFVKNCRIRRTGAPLGGQSTVRVQTSRIRRLSWDTAMMQPGYSASSSRMTGPESGGEIARRFIQKQDIRAALCHHQEHQLGFLPAGKPHAGMVHLVGGEFHAAQKDAGAASLFLFTGRGEQLDGGKGEIQQIAGILRHIKRRAGQPAF